MHQRLRNKGAVTKDGRGALYAVLAIQRSANACLNAFLQTLVTQALSSELCPVSTAFDCIRLLT